MPLYIFIFCLIKNLLFSDLQVISSRFAEVCIKYKISSGYNALSSNFRKFSSLIRFNNYNSKSYDDQSHRVCVETNERGMVFKVVVLAGSQYGE